MTIGPTPISLRSPRAITGLVLLIGLALVPVIAGYVGQSFYVTVGTRILVFALAASSLNVVLGYGGMVSFGHALYVGVGAYVVGISVYFGVTSGWVHLLMAIALCGLIAYVTGLICLRTSGIGFIMITLAFAQMFYFLFISLKQFGGDDGLPIPARSDFSPLSIRTNTSLYYFTLALLFAVLYLSWRFVHARFGRVLLGIKWNPRRMRMLGFPVLRYQVVAYVISGSLCGVAGLLLANLTRFHVSGLHVLDGVWRSHRNCDAGRNRHGARASGRRRRFPDPRDTAVRLLRALDARPRSDHCAHRLTGQTRLVRSDRPMSGPILRTQRLFKRFGGLVATDSLDLEVGPTELHAIIGPNGAGKTTLISQLVGELVPDAGTIEFDGRDVTALPTHRRAQLGLSRSYQIMSIFAEFTCLENVALAAQAHDGHSFGIWQPASRQQRLTNPAAQALDEVGLAPRSADVAAALAHGERRQLELAMALVSKPKLLLLDEPMAGMGRRSPR